MEYIQHHIKTINDELFSAMVFGSKKVYYTIDLLDDSVVQYLIDLYQNQGWVINYSSNEMDSLFIFERKLK